MANGKIHGNALVENNAAAKIRKVFDFFLQTVRRMNWNTVGYNLNAISLPT